MNPSEAQAKPSEKTKALCVATRCTTVEQFVATFHRFCDESSFFVATLATRPVGLETAFSIQLEDKTPVLRGLCVVVEAWSTPANRFGRPGVRLNVRRLTNESLPVFKQLQAARIAAEAAEKAKLESKPVESKPIESKPVESKPIESKPIESKPVEAKPVENAIEPKHPEKPKTLADKLAEIKSQPKTPPAIPPRRTDGIPPIPSALPKINPTAFAVKSAPVRPQAPSPSIIVEIDEPTKIEAKTVRAEGTAPVTRAEIEPAVEPAKPVAMAKPIEAQKSVDAPKPVELPKPVEVARPGEPAKSIAVRSADEPTATGPAPAMPAPIEAPTRPTPPPRLTNATTPAIGISTSTLNLSNAALTAEDTHAQAASYPDTASIVDAPPKPDVNPAAPEPIAASDDMTSPVASESRAPGSSFILPANPLMNLTDRSIEGFVDCALYEETGNFFRAPGYEDSLVDIDDVVAPPGVLAPTPAIRPGDEVSQAAYVITPTPAYVAQQQQFAQQEMTPMPVMGRSPTQPPYPTGQMVPLQYGQPYATGQMAPLQYPTGQMPPLQYPMHSGTTNPPYAMQTHPPQDTTAALLAMSGGASRRRWMIIGGAAVFASVVLLVIVIATRGSDKTATAATAPPKTEKQPDNKVTMAVTPPTTTPEPPAAPTKPPVATEDEGEPAAPSDPNAPPVMGSGPCTLTVTTTPAGSIVRLDDQVMGPSPITIQTSCTRKRVDVKHPRYAPGQKWVTLSESKPASVDLPLNRPTHAVTIVTQPAGATVSIAGRRAGTTPTSVKMMGFTKVALTIEKKGYKTVVESIYSKRDGERRMVTLTRGK
ncbi:MAG: PEGA domain-containing protein [Kofleriaceae bacterium]